MEGGKRRGSFPPRQPKTLQCSFPHIPVLKILSQTKQLFGIRVETQQDFCVGTHIFFNFLQNDQQLTVEKT